MFKNFSKSLNACILASFYSSGSPQFNIVFKNGVFSIGIIWSCFKQLIIISGISFVFAVGLKGAGLQIEFLFFNLVLWFLFLDTTNSTVSLPTKPSLLNQVNINSFTYIIGHIIRIAIQYLLILLLSFAVFFLYELEVYYIQILRCFIYMLLISFIYSTLMCALLHNKKFLIELHGFFMQAMFFASCTVIPINIVPNPVRDILLLNPIVHIQELIKSNVTGIELYYIDLMNPIIFISIGIFFILPSLHYKDFKCNQELEIE